jgi:hypothetical protein
MRKSNIGKKGTFSGNFLVAVASIFSILIIAASLLLPMQPSLSSEAFALVGDDHYSDQSISDIAKGSYNNNEVGEQESGGLIGNIISQRQSPQAYAKNVNADNKVIIVENCEDGEVTINDNDQIIQTNTQSFNQEATNEEEEEEEEEED